MYIVPPLWSHILWLYWGRNDSELVLWPVEWRLISVSPSDQSPRCTHGETLLTYLPIAKFRGVSPRNLAECLREISRSFSANFRGETPRNFAEKTLGEISDFYFSPRKKLFRARGVPRRNAKKKAFSLGWSVYRSAPDSASPIWDFLETGGPYWLGDCPT